ncbi:hypothetical protein SAMN05421759_12146 [Roseivivax lentus]|uniref:Uncharacterized protein n=1 Tax=Roseivivax lentus TaxID=633194 RepID=A0A1N7PWJ3_9RHOB|nr:hypothetical protein [Roseivivax lentus]SIT15033.1 hypothetical protein SAMN05421759_12146 [Roseivivax lentus]
MKTLAILATLAATLPMAALAQQQSQQSTVIISTQGQGAAMGDGAVPSENFRGQWFTTPDGCSYSRTQAPGYPVRWMLILNPRHIGQPNAHRGCKSML